MRGNFVVSMNFGGTYTQDNVRRSHAAAAGRWGANYIEITKPLPDAKEDDTFRQKLNLPAQFHRDSRLCLIDGDAIIAADCPSLFLRAGSTTHSIAGVANLQEGQPEACAESQSRYWAQAREYLNERGVLQATDALYAPDRYLNGGVLVGYADHMARVFALALWLADLIAEVPLDPMVEQTCLNMALRMMATGAALNQMGGVVLMEPEFNRICTDIWEPNRPMRHYIEHFAKLGQGCNGRDEILKTIDWQAPIAQPVEAG